MTIYTLLQEYADNKKDSTTVIRTLSGMFNPAHAVDILALINQITRVEQGDLDVDFLVNMYKPEDT